MFLDWINLDMIVIDRFKATVFLDLTTPAQTGVTAVGCMLPQQQQPALAV